MKVQRHTGGNSYAPKMNSPTQILNIGETPCSMPIVAPSGDTARLNDIGVHIVQTAICIVCPERRIVLYASAMEGKEHICHFPRNYGPRRFDYTRGHYARGVEVSKLMRREDVVYNR
jgi:hypothetical protein